MNSKVIKYEKKADCCGCAVCAESCHKKCIEMLKDEEGFLYPKINKEQCIQCGLCEKNCPNKNLENKNNEFAPKFLVAYNKNDIIRKNSSSGGIFSEIAKKFIERKGIVYGAALKENLEVEHIRINKLNEIEKIRGSKYVQSNLKGILKQVKVDLEDGLEVLFSGTPCQVAAIKKFLRKDYNNLYTCDVICHGVPSQSVLKKYIGEQEKKYKSKVKYIYFRDKEKGWNNFRIKILFENGKKYSCEAIQDPYMKSFFKNANLRPSCYQCKFSTLPRFADISLGDYWGVEKVHPKIKDDKGTSVVIINNNKGQKIIDQIKEKLYIENDENIEFIIQQNPCICGSVAPHKDRDNFFKDLNNSSVKQLSKKYFKEKFTMKQNIVRILRKMGIK